MTMSDDSHVDKYMLCTLQFIFRPHLEIFFESQPSDTDQEPGVDLEDKYTTI